jgi:RimJ/RimL family protein N-acetyltransferase
MQTMTFTVPRLETERLLLREPTSLDFEAYAQHMSDDDLRKYSGGALNRREAWRIFLVGAGSWVVTRSGWWMLEERASGSVVGTVGAFFREWNLDKGRDADLEIGWSLYRDAWRKGYAREAAAAAMASAVATHDPARVIAHIDKENVASAAVAKAIGITHAGATDFYGAPSELWVIDRRAK